MDDESIGRRIADRRKARGMTQAELAQAADVSLSLLQKVERGARDATQVLVAAVATVLDVDNTTLTGQPYDRDGQRADRIHALMPALRRALAYWDLPPELEVAPRSPAELAQEGAGLAKLRQRDGNAEVAKKLPPLLLEAFAVLRDNRDEHERQQLFDALMAMFYAAHVVTHQTGYEDLSVTIEDRIRWVAEQSEDPRTRAFSDWIRTSTLMRLGAYSGGLSLLDRSLSVIDPGAREDKGALRMVGSLHLRSAILASRANQAQTALDHIDEARGLLPHLGTTADPDNDWRRLMFGPTNVEIHAVATAVESGDGPGALALSDRLRLPEDTVRRLPTRAAHHYMDVSRAQLWQGQLDRSLQSLHLAKKYAPQQTRHHPTTREVMRVLVRSHYRANEPLAKFHAWLGGDL